RAGRLTAVSPMTPRPSAAAAGVDGPTPFPRGSTGGRRMHVVTRLSTAAGAAWGIGCLLLTTGTAQEAGPDAAELFDDTVVHELRLEMHGDDWSQLQAHYLENTYYPADLHWNGHVVRNIGVRSRGSGSRDA